MTPSTVRPYTLATIGHPGNKRVIVKTEQGYWRDVETGQHVDPEDFRAGWQPLVEVAELLPLPKFEAGHGRPDLDMLYQVYQQLSYLPVDEVRVLLRQYLVHRPNDIEPEPERPAQPGDHCRILGDFKVQHVAPCADGHPDGTVTDVRTGEIVERP